MELCLSGIPKQFSRATVNLDGETIPLSVFLLTCATLELTSLLEQDGYIDEVNELRKEIDDGAQAAVTALNNDPALLAYLETHPDVAERLKRLQGKVRPWRN